MMMPESRNYPASTSSSALAPPSTALKVETIPDSKNILALSTPPQLARAPISSEKTVIPHIDEYIDPIEMFFAGQRTAGSELHPGQVGEFLRDLDQFLPGGGNGSSKL